MVIKYANYTKMKESYLSLLCALNQCFQINISFLLSLNFEWCNSFITFTQVTYFVDLLLLSNIVLIIRNFDHFRIIS